MLQGQIGRSGMGGALWVVSPLDCMSSVEALEAFVYVVCVLAVAGVWVCPQVDQGQRLLCVLLLLPLPNNTVSRNLLVVFCQCRIRVGTGCLLVDRSYLTARVLQLGGGLPGIPSSEVVRVSSRVA